MVRTHECVTSIVFDAFCLEAYLNHLGYIKLSTAEFQNFEKLNPKVKLDKISETINFQVYKKRIPFCHFGNIFRFRDDIVHAKTFRVGPQRVKVDSKTFLPCFPVTIMDGVPTLENARKFYESTTEMVSKLNNAAGITLSPFGHPSNALWVGEY